VFPKRIARAFVLSGIAVGWPVVIAVSAIPPVVMALSVHLAVRFLAEAEEAHLKRCRPLDADVPPRFVALQRKLITLR